MGTLKDELIKAGLVKPEDVEKEKKEEFIKGEIQHAIGQQIQEHSVYKKPARSRNHKKSHGRAVIMNVKEEFDKKRISRDSVGYRIVHRLKNYQEWSSAGFISKAVSAHKPTVAAELSRMAATKIVQRKSAAGVKGYEYSLADANRNLTPDEIYLKHLSVLERPKKVIDLNPKKKKEPKEKTPVVPESKTGFSIPEFINVNISGIIRVVFDVSGGG